MIKALTFDLWDTVFIDDSDEEKRSKFGLKNKALSRRQLVYEAIKETTSTSIESVDIAYNTIDRAFRQAWYRQNVTWTVSKRLHLLLNELNANLSSERFEELVKRHEEMELEVMPDLAEGIQPALKTLSMHYKLGVISDTIFSPGRVLKKILAKYDILQYFDSFIFSDEIGCAKPDPTVFKKATEDLGISLNELAHIGDREEKDIAGPQALGSKAVLTTVVIDRGSHNSTADIICQDYSQLYSQLDQL